MLADFRSFCFLLFLLITFTVNSQIKSTFRHYTAGDGLSDNRITCSIKDREGFMWFGTWAGLCRFDGYNFKVYKSLPGDNSSLKNNRINGLIEDWKGFLWIIADDEQVYRFD